MKRAVSLLIIAALLAGCGSQKEEGPKILTGDLSPEQLYAEFPEYRTEMQDYTADDTAVKDLDKLGGEFTAIIFIGTYCPDCKRQVPRFLNVTDQLIKTKISYKIIGLDRSTNDKSGLREKHGIEFIPTFIIYSDSLEIGRIIETPMVSIEHDLLEICATAANDQ